VIVDCHTHWGLAWSARDAEDPARWLAILDRHGVDQAVLMGHANLVRVDWCAEDNTRLARLAALAPARLLPVMTAWPQAGEEGLAEVRRAIETLGARGLKFHPWLQGFSTADPVLHRMCALAGEAGIPVIFHDGTPCYSLPEQIAALARRLPQTQFVLGHAGILWAWRSALASARLPNLWLCLCGPHMRAMELLCREADPARLLWGTDFGFGLSDSIDYRLNAFRRARIDDALRTRILGENPARLLGLGGNCPPSSGF
jgi:predicted TIM-barrel fold metal-dependent hydrolase